MLSSLDLSVLDDEDVEEIIDRLEGDEEESEGKDEDFDEKVNNNLGSL